MAEQVYSLVITAAVNNQYVVNVNYFRVDETGGFTPIQFARDVISFWESLIKTKWLECAGPEYFLTSLKAKRVTGGGGPSAVKVYGPAVEVGTASTSVDDNGAAALMEFPVVLNGKNVYGKVFLAGTPSGFLTTNGYSATAFTKITALGDAMFTGGSGGVTGAVIKYVVYNRVLHINAVPDHTALGQVVGVQKARRYPI
jgi:hypothetical protein